MTILLNIFIVRSENYIVEAEKWFNIINMTCFTHIRTRESAAKKQTILDFGAPVECLVGQNFDKFWTNVQVLSNICPTFVQVLSMSNICQNN